MVSRLPACRSKPIWLRRSTSHPTNRAASETRRNRASALPGFRHIAVFEAHARRQAHQDRLGAPAGLQAEQRAAVVDQIEFDVAAAAIQLEFALALAVGMSLAALDDRQIGIEKPVADRLRQREAALEAAGIEIVEEQPADAARLVAVLEEEVLVAPALVARIDVVRRTARTVARDAVPMPRVLLERIKRRQVEAAAEPPDRSRRLRRAPRNSARSCASSARTDCADGRSAKRRARSTRARRSRAGARSPTAGAARR